MKILFVAREYPPFEVGGAAVHTFNLVKHLKELGISCKVISFGDPEYSTSDVLFIPPSSSIISKSNCSLGMDLRIPWDIIRLTKIVRNLIKREKFDIVHVQEPYVGAFARHNQKVTTIHDNSYGDIKALLHSDKSFVSMKRIAFYFLLGFFLEVMCIVSSVALITPSRQMARELVEIYQTPKNKIRIIRSGVNLPNLTELNNKKEAKNRLGLPQDKLLIFTTSQHIPRKRIDTLLNAILILQKRDVHGYQVVISGDGPLKPLLVNKSIEFGLSETVKFPGWISRKNLDLYYQATDIFVLTSEYEAGPITLLEAMSFGSAAVCSKIEGIPSLMQDKVDGLLFPVGDHVALSKHLNLLVSNVAIRRGFQVSARRFAEKFDWDSVAKDTLQVYERLIRTEHGTTI
jgi:glycosyltransferase involved in cell wall biosynthesis